MKWMFSCKDVHDRASDYIDHESGLLSRMAILMHTLMCKDCRTFVKQLKLTVTMVTSIKSPQDQSELDQLAEKLQKINDEHRQQDK